MTQLELLSYVQVGSSIMEELINATLFSSLFPSLCFVRLLLHGEKDAVFRLQGVWRGMPIELFLGLSHSNVLCMLPCFAFLFSATALEEFGTNPSPLLVSTRSRLLGSSDGDGLLL